MDTIGPRNTVQTEGQAVGLGSLAGELCSEPWLSVVPKSAHMHGVKIWEERLQKQQEPKGTLS